jgi:hypothetical protein
VLGVQFLLDYSPASDQLRGRGICHSMPACGFRNPSDCILEGIACELYSSHDTAFAVGQNGGMNRQDLFPNSLYLTSVHTIGLSVRIVPALLHGRQNSQHLALKAREKKK